MGESLKIGLYPEFENRIFIIRGMQVMIDSDLAEMYRVETKFLNRATKRNAERFPEAFMFQLTEEEYKNLRFQFGTSKNDDSLRFQIGTLKDGESLRSQFATLENGRGKHRKYLPYAFTEQGVAMLSAVLKSDIAVQVSVRIMMAFVEMRKFVASNAGLFQRLDNVEHKLLETDHKFEQVFKALESKDTLPRQGVFFDGQVFDAYSFVSQLIKQASKSIILIDNYVDESVLVLLGKKKQDVTCTLLTKTVSEQLKLDAAKFNKQYPSLKIIEFDKAHDRFLIIDESEVYHLGASLKDLGKKWFAFTRLEQGSVTILQTIKALL